jgi:pyruvate formate lyase activating enzyme
MADTSTAGPAEQRVPRGWIWDIKKYSLHDGPGIRTTVFFKGCPLTCLWCCNPESQLTGPELVWFKEKCLACGLCLATCPHGAVRVDESGRRQVDRNACDYCGLCVKRCPGEAMNLTGRLMEVDEILREVAQDSAFYDRSGGGLTLSGGEPLAQAAFAAELLRRYKDGEFGASTVVETSGAVEWEAIARVLPHTDLFLYDIKHMDSGRHRCLTGVGNERILENATRLAEAGSRLIIRFPLIPGCNDSEENVRETAEFARRLPGVEQVDILPYHRLGEPKYLRLGRKYALTGTNSASEDRVGYFRRKLESYGLRVGIGG